MTSTQQILDLSMIGSCIYCGGDYYVQITKLHNIHMSHETGITAESVDEPYIVCEQCFNKRIWKNACDEKSVIKLGIDK